MTSKVVKYITLERAWRPAGFWGSPPQLFIVLIVSYVYAAWPIRCTQVCLSVSTRAVIDQLAGGILL